eukprot:Rmarinus@m.8016
MKWATATSWPLRTARSLVVLTLCRSVTFKTSARMKTRCSPFSFWDSSGDPESVDDLLTVMSGMPAFVFVYDVSSRESFDYAKDLLYRLEAIKPITFKCLVGTKVDLVRQVSYTEAYSYAQSCEMDYVECSTLQQQNVREALDGVVHSMIDYVHQLGKSRLDECMKFGVTPGRLLKLGGDTGVPVPPRLSCSTAIDPKHCARHTDWLDDLEGIEQAGTLSTIQSWNTDSATLIQGFYGPNAEAQ